MNQPIIHHAERQILNRHIAGKGLKQSRTRDEVLEIFLSTERHLTPEELHASVKKRNPAVGIATIYRTLKLLCQCGLARELTLDGRVTRYEHLYGHEHHDHLVCDRCGGVTEVVDPEIERLQERLARGHRFTPKSHRMDIHGVCAKCR